MIPPIKYDSGAARPADCAVRVVVNAIANVGAMIEREKPKASMAPRDLRRFANPIPFVAKSGSAIWRSRTVSSSGLVTRLQQGPLPDQSGSTQNIGKRSCATISERMNSATAEIDGRKATVTARAPTRSTAVAVRHRQWTAHTIGEKGDGHVILDC